MVKHPISLGVLVLFSASIFIAGCESNNDQNSVDHAPSAEKVVAESTPGDTKADDVKKIADAKPDEKKPPDSGFLSMQASVNPTRPEDEVYLGDWRIFIFGVDDFGRKDTGFNYSVSTLTGAGVFLLPKGLLPYPFVVAGYNNVLPFACDEDRDDSNVNECRRFEIFIPAFCYDKTLWVIGPLEDAVWRYYKHAAMRHGAPWDPNLVDCASWIANLEALYLTDTIADELDEVTMFRRFDDEILHKAFRENQSLLVATHPPSCVAEERHDGGTMNDGESIELPFVLGDGVSPCPSGENFIGFDTIQIAANGMVDDVCGIPLATNLKVNSAIFAPTMNNKLASRDFMGVISKQVDIEPKLDVTVFTTQLGNGRELNSDIYKDACAFTNVIQFDNNEDSEKDLLANKTGVTFSNLFGDGANTKVYLTSDGDDIVDDTDFWAIFYRSSDADCEQQVIAVELLGHRKGDFRDNLYMTYDVATEDLFLGLRADNELEDAQEPGYQAFLSYTIHTWDGSQTDSGKRLRQQFATCYLATDPWALQFFEVNDSEYMRDISNADCIRECPLDFAEFAVRSQCFSNSRANQRWQNTNAGLWSMNSIKNVVGNIIVNPGWLGPDLNVEIFVQKFDEAVYLGPRTVRRTNSSGQLMVELPTLVEGDRVLIKAEDSCCDDRDLVIPCAPAYTNIVGAIGPPLP